MKNLVLLLAIIGCAVFQLSAQNKEIEAVKVPLDNYLQGHITGDPGFIRKAFQQDARITAFREDKFLNWDLDEFVTRFDGKPAKDEAKRKRKIERIDISGNAAIAKIVLDYPTIKFVDYMTLLKADGEWKIVSKSFHAELRNKVEKVNFKSAAEEKPDVEATLNNYLKGQATGNPDFFRQAFYKDARIMIFRGGKIDTINIEELAGLYKNGKVADDEAKRKRRIESVDISGNAAIAKTILDYPTMKITDYMSLLKIDGEWKIVNKSPYIEPKEQSKE